MSKSSNRFSRAVRVLFGRGGAAAKSNLLAELVGGAAGGGKAVSEAQAMSVPAFNLAVTLISDTLASLPLRLKRREERDVVVVEEHPFYDVFRRPCGVDRPGFTGSMLLRSLLQQVLIHGNGYVEQVRVDGGRKLRLLKPIDQSRVELEIDGERALYRVSPREGVRVTNGGVERQMRSPDLIHIRGRYVDPEGWCGLSTLGILRGTLNISLAQLRHARESLYGGNLNGYLSPEDGELAEEAMRELATVFNSPDWDNKTPLLPYMVKWTSMRGNNVEAQFDQSRAAQVIDIGRIFNVPPHLLLHVSSISNWGSGLTEQAAGFVRYTLSPWAERIENAFDAALLTDAERASGLFFEFDFNKLLRGNAKDRALIYAQKIAAGVMTPAEARQDDGLPWMEGTDELRPTGAAPISEPEPKREPGDNPPSPEDMPSGD